MPRRPRSTVGLDQLAAPARVSYLSLPRYMKHGGNFNRGWRRELAQHKAWATRKSKAAITLPSFKRGED